MKVEYVMPLRQSRRSEPRYFSNMGAHGYEWGIMFDQNDGPAWRAYFLQPTTQNPIEFLHEYKHGQWSVDCNNSRVNVEGSTISTILKTYRMPINDPTQTTVIRLGKKIVEIEYFSRPDEYAPPIESILNPNRTIEIEGSIDYVKKQIIRKTSGKFQRHILESLDTMLQTTKKLL